MPPATPSYGAIDVGSTAKPKKSSKNGGKQRQDTSFSSAVYHPWLRVVAFVSLIILIGITFYGKSTHSNSYQFNRYMSDSSKAAAQLLSVKNTDNENYELHDENEACFYDEQLVDHFSTSSSSSSTWSNRYYKSTNYFRGPGHPIFLVVGGEGALDNGMLYPFVTQHLAPRFGAAGEFIYTCVLYSTPFRVVVKCCMLTSFSSSSHTIIIYLSTTLFHQ
jgi:hypothetical protein